MTSSDPDPRDPSNNKGLRVEVSALVEASEALIAPAHPDDHVDVTLLGNVLLARELAAGVLSETNADPPRGLNAMRLARHLWELEIEVHYVSENPDSRLHQLLVREARNRLEMWRSHGPRSRRPPMSPAFEAVLREAEAEGAAKDAVADERKAAGEKVVADDWGGVPSLLVVTKSLARKQEYYVYYSLASLYSHPSVATTDSTITTRDGVVVPDAETRVEAGMALSLTRTTLARLLLRSARLRRTVGPKVVEELHDFMVSRGIAEGRRSEPARLGGSSRAGRGRGPGRANGAAH